MSNVTPPSNNCRKSFSPIFVWDSPVKRIAQSGNLTGEPRLVRDLAAELHALSQKWSVLHLEGLQQLMAMVPNIDLYREDRCESSILQDQCDHLDDIWKSMAGVVESIDITAKQYHSLEAIMKISQKPMFLTWPPSQFSEVSSRLSQAYQAELATKHRVMENIAHSPDRATVTYYMALWMHQVHLDSDVQLSLESLLLETGHRSIS